ncbi:phage minor head protein [Nakamurella panacisegetis]|nr:phage minor head protein [Nakamurella panacisegetis]
MAAQFNQQKAEILAHLDTTRIGTKNYTRKDWLQDLLDWAEAAGSFKTAIQPVVHATLLQAGQDAIQGVGLEASQFDPFTPAIVEYFQNRSIKIAKDVTYETEKQLRAALSQSVVDGKSSYELRGMVENVMGSASTMRADRIARTEVSRSQGYGDIQAWKQSGVVEGKEWFTAEDEHVCPFCDDLDHTIVGLDDNFFDKGDTLEAGGQAMAMNYDDVPSCPLHVNCRCVLLPVRA